MHRLQEVRFVVFSSQKYVLFLLFIHGNIWFILTFIFLLFCCIYINTSKMYRQFGVLWNRWLRYFALFLCSCFFYSLFFRIFIFCRCCSSFFFHLPFLLLLRRNFLHLFLRKKILHIIKNLHYKSQLSEVNKYFQSKKKKRKQNLKISETNLVFIFFTFLSHSHSCFLSRSFIQSKSGLLHYCHRLVSSVVSYVFVSLSDFYFFSVSVTFLSSSYSRIFGNLNE